MAALVEITRFSVAQEDPHPIDILFVAPERQQNQLWQDRVPHMAIKGLVIDEAHCISQWGHDFRPSYKRLVDVTINLGLRTPVLALTATAPGDVVADIRQQVAPSSEDVKGVRLRSHRPNIELAALSAKGFAERLAHSFELATKHAGQPGLVYVLTTEEAPPRQPVKPSPSRARQLAMRSRITQFCGRSRVWMSDVEPSLSFANKSAGRPRKPE